MPSQLLLTIALACCLTGCFGKSADRTPAVTSEFEILDNPKILADPAVPIEKMTLRGVALGDPREVVKPNRIYTQDNNGWLLCRDSDRYRVLNDKVVTLGVWDQKALSRLGVNEEADIERVFGKAEAVEKVDTFSTKMTIYRFANGQRRASWDRILNRLATVNIGSAIVLPVDPKP